MNFPFFSAPHNIEKICFLGLHKSFWIKLRSDAKMRSGQKIYCEKIISAMIETRFRIVESKSTKAVFQNINSRERKRLWLRCSVLIHLNVLNNSSDNTEAVGTRSAKYTLARWRRCEEKKVFLNDMKSIQKRKRWVYHDDDKSGSRNEVRVPCLGSQLKFYLLSPMPKKWKKKTGPVIKNAQKRRYNENYFFRQTMSPR